MTTIWFQQREHAEDLGKLRMVAIAHKLPMEDYASIVEGRFRVVPNTQDARGGFLVIIGSPHPPEPASAASKTRRFLTRLFGRTSTAAQNDHQLLASRLADHVARVNTLGGSHSKFIDEHLTSDIVQSLSTAAAEKMALTQLDHREHSFCFSRTPVSYWICTVPYSVIDAKTWFGNAYGGYSKLLERAWNSEHFKQFDCEVLVHVVFGRASGETWVNLAIFPVGTQRFGIKAVLPVDLLTEAETNLAGATPSGAGDSSHEDRRQRAMSRLLGQVFGDHSAADRLIDFERRRDPSATELECIEAASKRIIDDNTGRWS